MTADEVETFGRCMSVGGVALFPTDTVYGLATEPESKEGVRRLYGLKGRVPDKPAAVMFFDLELALAAVPELGPRTARRCGGCCPAAVTGGGAQPGAALSARLRPRARAAGPAGARLDGALAPLAAVRWPVLQSSANRSGDPDVRRLEDVEPASRGGVDLALDGGSWPARRPRSSTLATTSRMAPPRLARGGGAGGRDRVRAQLSGAVAIRTVNGRHHSTTVE